MYQEVPTRTAGARLAKYEFDPTAQAGGQLVHNDPVLFRLCGCAANEVGSFW